MVEQEQNGLDWAEILAAEADQIEAEAARVFTVPFLEAVLRAQQLGLQVVVAAGESKQVLLPLVELGEEAAMGQRDTQFEG